VRTTLALVDEVLAAWWDAHPIDASFAGEIRYDDRLPAADRDAPRRERERWLTFHERLAAESPTDDVGLRLDRRLLSAALAHAASDAVERTRFANPAWYTGEAAFALIALLLPSDAPRDPGCLIPRLEALPGFLDAGIAQLRGRSLPVSWVERARAEARALDALLAHGLPLHPWAAQLAHAPVAPVQAALARFRAALVDVPDADPRCGEEHLRFIMNDVHGLDETPAGLERRAQYAYDAALEELERQARDRNPSRSWREQLNALAEIGPAAERDDEVIASYRDWHEHTLRDAATLLTPASDYGLRFAPIPPWAQAVADALYFLFYRSPAARFPGAGSTYWVGSLDLPAEGRRRAHNTAAVKMIHAVHHGSIGHHTQNARARAAKSKIARISGTDGASALAFLSAGTMVEGWACYAEDLMAEVPGFYTPAEELQRAYFTFRNIACCLADVRLHSRIWTLEEMQRFYRDDVGFAPARIVSETTRNSMFPGSRLMYWTGTEQIAALRRRSARSAREVHDELLAFGSMPVAWIAEELA